MNTAKKLSKDVSGPADVSYDPDAPGWKRGRHAGKTLQLPLASLRGAAAKTQVQVAEESGIAQSEVSKIERRDSLDELQVSTLRRYIKALGGELEIVAVIGGRRIAVTAAARDT